MYILNLGRESHNDVDFEGSRHQFRLGPELLPSLTAWWSKCWHRVTGVAGLIPRLTKALFSVCLPTCLFAFLMALALFKYITAPIIVQYSTVQCNTVKYRTAQCITVTPDMTQYTTHHSECCKVLQEKKEGRVRS